MTTNVTIERIEETDRGLVVRVAADGRQQFLLGTVGDLASVGSVTAFLTRELGPGVVMDVASFRAAVDSIKGTAAYLAITGDPIAADLAGGAL